MNWKLKTILLAAMMTSLGGCSQVIPRPYCPTAVKASPEVKQWMEKQKPLPIYVKEYFNAIGDEQKTIEDNCG